MTAITILVNRIQESDVQLQLRLGNMVQFSDELDGMGLSFHFRCHYDRWPRVDLQKVEWYTYDGENDPAFQKVTDEMLTEIQDKILELYDDILHNMTHSEDFKQFMGWLKETAPTLSAHLDRTGLDSLLPTYWLLYKNSNYDSNKPRVL